MLTNPEPGQLEHEENASFAIQFLASFAHALPSEKEFLVSWTQDRKKLIHAHACIFFYDSNVLQIVPFVYIDPCACVKSRKPWFGQANISI